MKIQDEENLNQLDRHLPSVCLSDWSSFGNNRRIKVILKKKKREKEINSKCVKVFW